MSAKKPNPFAKMMQSEKKEGKKEPKESMKMMGMEKKMGVEKPAPFKFGKKAGKK